MEFIALSFLVGALSVGFAAKRIIDRKNKQIAALDEAAEDLRRDCSEANTRIRDLELELEKSLIQIKSLLARVQ